MAQDTEIENQRDIALVGRIGAVPSILEVVSETTGLRHVLVRHEQNAGFAADGFARALRPVHTPFDGDLVFAVTTAAVKIAEPRQRDVLRIGRAPTVAGKQQLAALAQCLLARAGDGEHLAHKFGVARRALQRFERAAKVGRGDR